MLSRLINGLIAGLIAWSVTHSEWIALVVFGATAGLSSNKFKWAEEIVKTIKEEAGKAKDASTTSTSQPSPSGMQSAAAKLAASLNISPELATRIAENAAQHQQALIT